MIKNWFLSWRTTSAGLVMIVGSIVHLVFAVRAGTATEGVWTASLGAIISGIGLVAAGDSAQSRKQVQQAKEQVADAITSGHTERLLNSDAAKPNNPS